MTAAPASLGRLWALMLTVFVDMVGFLMILPLQPLYAEGLGASPWLITAMISTYAVAQLMTAPAWGRLSDRHGRRPVLMAGISIAAVAHGLFALACSQWAMDRVDAPMLIGLLFLSRFVQGGGGATTGVVQAYIADAIVPEERSKALGWITAATSAGVMLGPAIGSLVVSLDTSGSKLSAAPGVTAALLCLVNLIFVQRWLPESSSSEARSRATREPQRSLRSRVVEIVAHPRRPVARLIWIYGVGMMAFIAINAVQALYLSHRFGMTAQTIGYVYTLTGTVALIMRSLLLGPAVRRYGDRGVVRHGLLVLTAAYGLLPLAGTLTLFVGLILLVPVGTALLFPATTSLVSRYSAGHEHGAVMGVQQVWGGVARLIGPIWAGFAYQFLGIGSPFWIAAAVTAATVAWALGLEPPPVPRQPAETVAAAAAGPAPRRA